MPVNRLSILSEYCCICSLLAPQVSMMYSLLVIGVHSLFNGWLVLMLQELMDGTTLARGGTNGGNAFVAVDVRDVALAHLRAAERPEAKGRYTLHLHLLLLHTHSQSTEHSDNST